MLKLKLHLEIGFFFYSPFQALMLHLFDFAKINLLQNAKICDAIWENPSDIAKWHFEKWLEIVRKLVYNSTELLNTISL